MFGEIMNNIGIAGRRSSLRAIGKMCLRNIRGKGEVGIRVSTLKVHLMQDTESVTIRAYHMPPIV